MLGPDFNNNDFYLLIVGKCTKEVFTLGKTSTQIIFMGEMPHYNYLHLLKMLFHIMKIGKKHGKILNQKKNMKQ